MSKQQQRELIATLRQGQLDFRADVATLRRALNDVMARIPVADDVHHVPTTIGGVNAVDVTIQGIDTGNLKVGGPMLADPGHDGNMFLDYAKAYNAALIPIINSNNAGSTTLVGVGTDVGAVGLDALLVELDTTFL
jgi:hypothetical protein